MPQQDDHRKAAEVKLARRGNMAAAKARLLALPERWLCPADQLDYMIRRRVIPVPFEANRSIAPNPFFRWSLPREYSRGISGSMPRKQASMRSNGILSEVQAAIGRHLGAEYELAQPIPARLVDLLRQLEQQKR
jgi:hypothetical protein